MIVKQTPMSIETQHFVLMPDWDGIMYTGSVYAASPEAAVEETRRIFRSANEDSNDDIDAIRLAQGNELPWMSGKHWIVRCGEKEVGTVGESREAVEETYRLLFEGKPFTVRPMTPVEAEASVRQYTLDKDVEDEEQFNYGFNVLYHEMRDAELG